MLRLAGRQQDSSKPAGEAAAGPELRLCRPDRGREALPRARSPDLGVKPPKFKSSPAMGPYLEPIASPIGASISPPVKSVGDRIKRWHLQSV